MYETQNFKFYTFERNKNKLKYQVTLMTRKSKRAKLHVCTKTENSELYPFERNENKLKYQVTLMTVEMKY